MKQSQQLKKSDDNSSGNHSVPTKTNRYIRLTHDPLCSCIQHSYKWLYMVHWLGNTRNTSSGSPSVYNYILSNVYPFELLVHAILQLLAKIINFQNLGFIHPNGNLSTIHTVWLHKNRQKVIVYPKNGVPSVDFDKSRL